VSIVGFGIRQLTWGAIVVLRGIHAFPTETAYLRAIPSLAWLFPAGPIGLILAAFDPFGVWSTFLLATAMREGLGAGRSLSWSAAIAIQLLPALLVLL
jgi:hypothetical protein